MSLQLQILKGAVRKEWGFLSVNHRKNQTDLGIEAEKQLGKAFTWPRVGVLAMSGKEKTFHIEEKACAKALG